MSGVELVPLSAANDTGSSWADLESIRKCSGCASLVLAADVERHAAWHRALVARCFGCGDVDCNGRCVQ